ncbi:MAG: 3-dehydroquinate synthase II [Thermoplasmata archaeon]|nr:3-dehydroquinate synthase II [Thermoplasmata archaeon]
MDLERIVLRLPAERSASDHELVELALRRGFRRFANLGEGTVPDGLERVDVLPDRYESSKTGVVPRRLVASPEELARAIDVGRSAGAVAVEWANDRVIPLETVVAERRGEFRLWVAVSRIAEVPAALGALEHGADTVVVEIRTAEQLGELEAILDARPLRAVVWEDATVATVRPVGLSDRVLLDTTSLLGPSEGLAVGSQAATLFLVLSEAVGSRFTRPRPFRVNAGAAHSYVLMADGSTRYLSEVEPGEELLAITAAGTSRGVRLGRRKVERRPSVLVEVHGRDTSATVFLQEAETVRLSGRSGPVPVTSLVPGATIRVTRLPAARHLGQVVTESIEER